MSLNLHQEPSRQLKLSDETKMLPKLSRQPKFPYEIRTDKHLLGELQIN